MLIYNLPKKYLSYSACMQWMKSKDQFRKRYYENEPSLMTSEMVFGKRIASLLENDEEVKKHPVLSLIPRLPVSEYSIEVDIEGIPVKGYLDMFNPEDNSFVEIKTGHLSKEGKVPWSNISVAKHLQLDFYSLLIKSKHGKVAPMCNLIWLETEFKNKTIEFDGHILTGETRELDLTGRFEIFNRRIHSYERDLAKSLIQKIALEISEDYTSYLTKCKS